MTGPMDIDPATLLELALQHERVAEDTRKWAEPPAEWLAKFPETYGKIADPVHHALHRYYDARQRAGEALADGHSQTAAALRASAQAYEDADHAGASSIRTAGDPHRGPEAAIPPAGGGGPGGPGGPSGGHGAGPGTAPAAAPDTPSAPAPAGPGDLGDAGGGPGTHATTPTGPDGWDPSGGGPAAPAGPGMVPPMPMGPGYTGPNSGGPGQGAGFAPAGGGGGPAGPDGPRPSGSGYGTTIFGPTPFAAAVSAARDRQDEPAVVNGAANDDLLIAQTLLGAVLAAVDSSVAGTAWAVSVMRGPAGAGVFITSNEGRGWLPPAVFLPREVSTPWLWDEVLDPEGTGAGSPWEGVSDPARVLVEFGLAWGPQADAEISAVASSGPIDASLRARLGEVPMQGLVGPSYDVDLRVFTPDTADRLGLTGSVSALQDVAAVADSSVRARCVELAADADAQVLRAVPATPEVAAARRLREAILDAVQANRPVPRTLWDELRDADDLLAAGLLTRRVDVGRVEIGALRLDDEAAALRALVFERRCNELVLLLSTPEPTRQHLRDAVYAHEQIVDHPQFVAAPSVVSAPESGRAASGAVPGGAISASPVSGPAVSAGPPQDPPPVVLPGGTAERK